LGTRRGRPLILALVLAALTGASSLHLEPTLAAPSLAGRVDSVLRDSLRARGADLYPLDSLVRLQGRLEWPTGEKTPSTVARLKALTKRTTVGWVRIDMPDPEFKRIAWFPVWARREWVLRGEVYRSSGDSGSAVERFSIRQEMSLGFVGTWGAEQFPPTSADVRKALDVLLPEVVSRIAGFLAVPDASAR
jgi:hypothetical protein